MYPVTARTAVKHSCEFSFRETHARKVPA